MDSLDWSTWLEIDLAAIRNNVSRLRDLSDAAVMAIVKANGYGHGAIPAAQAAVEGGAAWCGVSRLEEALALRHAGLVCPILVLGYTPPARLPQAMANQVSLTVYDPELAASYVECAREGTGEVRVHVKVETGMGRLGIDPAKALDLIRYLREQPGIMVEGIFTHFARADEPDVETTQQQLDRFQKVLDGLKSNGHGLPPMIHASNSAGAIYFKDARFNLIRVGAAMYGLDPSPQAPLPPDFYPALSWKTRITSIKDLSAGHGVSYGSRYITRKTERIGVIPVGYADGLRRVDHQQVLIHGELAPIVGSVCMDQCMVQLDGLPQARLEDEVVVIGRQGNRAITSEDLARRWGTINYEVVCGLANRIPRIYLNASGKNQPAFKP